MKTIIIHPPIKIRISDSGGVIEKLDQEIEELEDSYERAMKAVINCAEGCLRRVRNGTTINPLGELQMVALTADTTGARLQQTRIIKRMLTDA